jgi:gliotoxin/aspirochlorine biosynthesis thioredoxin reductase
MGSTETYKTYDVLILGGGISGLAAALTLARQQHTAVVLDSEVYRNASSPHMHNVLTWDHTDPREFRAAARKNIVDYYTTIDFVNADVVTLEEGHDRGQQLLTATDREGKFWRGRKLILAVGVEDLFPKIEGYADCWAKGM